MDDDSLEKVIALNDELAALAAAGVPVDVGVSDEPLDSALARINSSLALRTGLGQSVATAVAQSDELPTAYRHAVLAGLQTDRLSLALDGVTRQAVAGDDLRRTLGYSFIQPLVIFALAYGGFIVLCQVFSPRLEEIYEQSRQVPNAGVQFLAACREWMPVWLPMVPLGLVLALVLWRWLSRSRTVPLPGSQRYRATIKHALFAEQAARLMDHGVIVPESLQNAAKAVGDAELSRAVETVVALREQAEPVTPQQAQELRKLPPFLRWVLNSNAEPESLARLLGIAAETYRQSVDRQASLWHLLLPTIVSAVLGGLIVAVFAILMYGTYIGMLWDLAL